MRRRGLALPPLLAGGLLLLLAAAAEARAGTSRRGLRSRTVPTTLVAANTTAGAPSRILTTPSHAHETNGTTPEVTTPSRAHETNGTTPEEFEHGGSPGEGGGHMVPRAHVDGREELSHPQHWTYAHPELWGKESYEDCNGKSQSPINIDSGGVLTEEGKQNKTYLADSMNYYILGERSISNNGHNLQVDGEFGTLTLPDGEYKVKQLHFHMPSEHEINGKLAAGEIHIVHQRKGSNGTDDLAVVAILLETSESFKNELAFLKNLGFGAHLPKENEKVRLGGPVNLNVFSQRYANGFWHYRGSLTTPPCSQTVHWYVLQQAASVTPEMVDSFKAIFPSPQNNRPVQPLNGRQVVYSEVALDGEFPKEATALEEKEKSHETRPGKSAAPRTSTLAALAAAGFCALL